MTPVEMIVSQLDVVMVFDEMTSLPVQRVMKPVMTAILTMVMVVTPNAYAKPAATVVSMREKPVMTATKIPSMRVPTVAKRLAAAMEFVDRISSLEQKATKRAMMAMKWTVTAATPTAVLRDAEIAEWIGAKPATMAIEQTLMPAPTPVKKRDAETVSSVKISIPKTKVTKHAMTTTSTITMHVRTSV